MELKDIAALQRMYAKEKHLERQLVLMTILKQSPEATQLQAVKSQKIVANLQAWITSAVEQKEFRLAFRVLETLERLPIDLDVLKVILLDPDVKALLIMHVCVHSMATVLHVQPGAHDLG